MSFLITGASGQLGRLTAQQLLDRVDPAEVILVTRNPAALADLAQRGASVRRGDFDEPGTLREAFAGADRMLLISGVDFDRRVIQHQNAIDAAREAGVAHIAYTSVLDPVDGNPNFVVPDHRETEARLAAGGVPHAFLRNAFYSDMRDTEAQGALASGTLATNFGDGRHAFVSRADCAAAAVAVLTGGPEHDNQSYDITGPQALGAAELAALYGAVGSTSITVRPLDDDAYIAGLESVGVPAFFANGMASFGRSVREGFGNQQTDAVQRLTGHAPATAESILRGALASA